MVLIANTFQVPEYNHKMRALGHFHIRNYHPSDQKDITPPQQLRHESALKTME